MSVGKVTDTASFIARAKEVHGDKYDHSQSVFRGAQKPITIVCRACGPFTLAHAGTHYRTGKRPCECRCEGNRKYKTCKCGFVGYGKEQFPERFPGLCHVCQRKTVDAYKSPLMQKIFSQFRDMRKTERTKQWRDKWMQLAYKKYNVLASRRRSSTPGDKPIFDNWDAKIGLMRMRLRDKEDQWTEKCRRWQRGLVIRQREQKSGN